jgi:hypothetical protein
MKAPTKTLLKKLEQWHVIKAQAAELVAQEQELRKEIFAMAFPNPEEGSKYNKLDLPEGYILQGDYKINRRIDEAALGEVQKKMDPVAFGRTFKFKPELIKAGLKDISEEQRAIASICIIATPGTPALDRPKEKIISNHD